MKNVSETLSACKDKKPPNSVQENTRLERAYCTSFPPSAEGTPEILILGSMPGGESLKKNQYYAFKHNIFWRLAGSLFGFDPLLPYPDRLAALRASGVALWDVLASCRRAGSLDSAIRGAVPNAIPQLLERYPSIRKIACNGTCAMRYLTRFFPEIAQRAVLLPSTSPAAAQLTFEEKLTRWRRFVNTSSACGSQKTPEEQVPASGKQRKFAGIAKKKA